MNEKNRNLDHTDDWATPEENANNERAKRNRRRKWRTHVDKNIFVARGEVRTISVVKWPRGTEANFAFKRDTAFYKCPPDGLEYTMNVPHNITIREGMGTALENFEGLRLLRRGDTVRIEGRVRYRKAHGVDGEVEDENWQIRAHKITLICDKDYFYDEQQNKSL